MEETRALMVPNEVRSAMEILKEELRATFDVDETLILVSSKYEWEGLEDPVVIKLDYYGQVRYRRIHQRHVELLKAHKERGFHITVHSNNGWRWAEEVVNKLGLAPYVDRIETKPQFTCDDKEDCGIARVWVDDL